MKPHQIEKSELQCDEKDCDWVQETPWVEIKNWHKKSCPKCGKGEIVSDEDLAVWNQVNAILLINNVIDPERKMPRIDIDIDTSELRV